MTTRRRQWTLIGAAGLLALSGGFAFLQLSHQPGGDLRPGFSPPLQVENKNGKVVVSSQSYMMRAYPGTHVTQENLVASLDAHDAIRQRGFKGGKGAKGTWVAVGPHSARVPYSQLETVDPNQSYRFTNGYVGGRASSVAISPNCTNARCRVWVGSAAGGIWRTEKGLSSNPTWSFVSTPLAINTIGSITQDPNDLTGDTLWVGTGEVVASLNSVAGVGFYKTTDGGDTWEGPFDNGGLFRGRGLPALAITPGDSSVMYAALGRSLNGLASASGAGITINIPGAGQRGLYKSTDGGQTWNLIFDECQDLLSCSLSGVRDIKIDPVDPSTVYVAAWGIGVWRSNDAGASWTQIKPALVQPDGSGLYNRANIAVTELPNGKTRMYVGEGEFGGPNAGQFFRSDDVRTGSPVFTSLSSPDITDDGFSSYNFCTGQCWYDLSVTTPQGHPDIVYLGGAPNAPYSSPPEDFSNFRVLLLSQNAGESFTDVSCQPAVGGQMVRNCLHVDHHNLAISKDNPFLFFSVNDGGVARSSGELVNASHECAERGLEGDKRARCEQLLSAIPTRIIGMNKGLHTLAFNSLSVSPANSNWLMGGTQDNATWMNSRGNPRTWTQSNGFADGGQSGFDAEEQTVSFSTWQWGVIWANFTGGDPRDWSHIGYPAVGASSPEVFRSAFYIPAITDPVLSKTIYTGLWSVWRTKTFGLGHRTLEEHRATCSQEKTSLSFLPPEGCGDFVALGSPTGLTSSESDLGSQFYGGDRVFGFIQSVERAPSDTGTLWASTWPGRVFVSKNADAEHAAVTFIRIDDEAVNGAPGRVPAAIFVDPTNADRAFIVYDGYNSATPLTPGHVFSVEYDPDSQTATWTRLDGDGPGSLGDIPLTDVAYDHLTGDLYVSSDFGVFRKRAGAGSPWEVAAPGMPPTPTPGLTIAAEARKLYAATHGLGAWLLNL
jgi:hypothetical protein